MIPQIPSFEPKVIRSRRSSDALPIETVHDVPNFPRRTQNAPIVSVPSTYTPKANSKYNPSMQRSLVIVPNTPHRHPTVHSEQFPICKRKLLIFIAVATCATVDIDVRSVQIEDVRMSVVRGRTGASTPL